MTCSIRAFTGPAQPATEPVDGGDVQAEPGEVERGEDRREQQRLRPAASRVSADRNCGRKVTKNSATFGLSALRQEALPQVRRPRRRPRRRFLGRRAAGPGRRAQHLHAEPQQVRRSDDFSTVNAVAEASSSADSPRAAALACTVSPSTPPSIGQQPAGPAADQRVAGDQGLVRPGNHDQHQRRDRECRHRRTPSDDRVLATSLPPMRSIGPMSIFVAIPCIESMNADRRPAARDRGRPAARVGHRCRQGAALHPAVGQSSPRQARGRDRRPAAAAGRPRDPADRGRPPAGRPGRRDRRPGRLGHGGAVHARRAERRAGQARRLQLGA